jgi:glycosyltransferase involved in cell wall biosynthesis
MALNWNAAARALGQGMLSVVMPSHNLGPVIAANVLEVCRTFRGRFPFEVVVADDGSDDDTLSELARVAAQCPELICVSLKQNSGKGEALKRGFLASHGTYVLFLDGDLDLPAWQTCRLFDVMDREQADVVIGSKQHPESKLQYPWHRRIISRIYYLLVKMMLGLPLHDTQTGIKLFKRNALEFAYPRLLVKRFAFDIEMLAVLHEQGYRLAESPIILEFQGKWGYVKPSAAREVMVDTLAVFYRIRILHYYQAIRHVVAPHPPPRISVVIAYPNYTHYMDECLEGLRRQTYTHFDAIILPDRSGAGRQLPAWATEIPTGAIRPAEKRNIGIKNSVGDIVAFIDDDAFPDPYWLEQAVVHFADPTVGAVGGPGSTPPTDPYLAMLSGRIYENPLVSGEYRYRYTPTRVRDVDDFPSCNLLVRASVLREVGGFRTDFWPGEDTYLCMDIVKRLGLKIVYDPRVHVYHHRRRLFLPHLRQIGRYALHRGYFAKRFPSTSRRIGYMMPSLFVAGLILGIPLALCSNLLRTLYFSVLAIYGMVTLLSCISLNPLTWLLTWVGLMMTHGVYGIRFMMGLLTDRLPGEVKRFDHPSEKPTVQIKLE